MKKLLEQSGNLFHNQTAKLFLTFLFLFLPFLLKAQTVSITTDQDDYYPGEWVIITGTGWTPGDTVKLSITHIGDSIPNHTHAPWTLVVDAAGNLSDEWYVAEMELNTTLWLQSTKSFRIDHVCRKGVYRRYQLDIKSSRLSSISFKLLCINGQQYYSQFYN